MSRSARLMMLLLCFTSASHPGFASKSVSATQGWKPSFRVNSGKAASVLVHRKTLLGSSPAFLLAERDSLRRSLVLSRSLHTAALHGSSTAGPYWLRNAASDGRAVQNAQTDEALTRTPERGVLASLIRWLGRP